MIAFDSDVLIYTVIPEHPHGDRVFHLLERRDEEHVGSVLLLPEVLSKPMRLAPASAQTASLAQVLDGIALLPVDEVTATFAMALGAKYKLCAADAVHLATAVIAGADRFLTNNRRDFPTSITEIDITYPDELPAPN